MSHLTRYPNQFYQPTPLDHAPPVPEAGSDPEEIPFAEPAVTPAPPLAARGQATLTSVSADGLSVLGLDQWSVSHGAR